MRMSTETRAARHRHEPASDAEATPIEVEATKLRDRRSGRPGPRRVPATDFELAAHRVRESPRRFRHAPSAKRTLDSLRGAAVSDKASTGDEGRNIPCRGT